LGLSENLQKHVLHFKPMNQRFSFFSFYFAFSVLGGREASA
jgi:hypothetical protein